jgi:phosphate starvation-inducible protein PhoH
MPLPKSAELFYGLKLDEYQKEYADSIFDNQLTIVNAKAGTGKTSIAVGCAKIIGKPLYYIFSPTQEKVLGYLPGSLEDKEYHYTAPLHDALLEIGENPQQAIYNEKEPKNSAWVYTKSHTFLRGTNLKDCTIILDEFQNYDIHSAQKTLTRIHDSCTVIISGHTGQIDLPKNVQSGFEPYMRLFKDKDYCRIIELKKNYRGRLSNDSDKILEYI